MYLNRDLKREPLNNQGRGTKKRLLVCPLAHSLTELISTTGSTINDFKSLAVCSFTVGCYAEVTGKEYASMPDLFYQDNFDNCMMRGDEAFYCGLTYVVEPINKENPSKIWTIIKKVNYVRANYRHNQLRRWICVPKTCPGINKTNENDPLLKRALEDCLNKKCEEMGLKGTILLLKCETEDQKYPVDWLDIFAGVLFISHIAFVLYATYYEGVARYKPPEEYEKLTSTRTGKVIAACSITRNWIRLKTINSSLEIEKLRCIQGIRVYNTGLVILCHTVMSFLATPIINTRFPETMHEKNATLFFSSGPLCVATFFFISAFLLSNSIFEYMKEKEMSFKTVLFIFANRLFRLTPTVFVIVLFHATLLRHLGSGPNWDHFIHVEYKKCRMNGWTNLMYINNWVDPANMCLPVTWYLALDTQYFFVSLLFIWLIKAYERYVWFIIGSAVSLIFLATFMQNYYYDFTALVLPTAEMYYGLNQLFGSHQFQHQLCSVIGNIAGPTMGIAFGYYFCKHKNDETPFFNTQFRQGMWWIFTFVLGLGFVIIPGKIILNESTEHNAFWASFYVALSRPLFTFVIGLGIIGFTEGIGWLALRTCQWAPTYVLGRLTFNAYLVHMSIVLLRGSLARQPLNMTDFQLLIGFFGDLFMVYIVATLLTLLLELPMSELQKHVFGLKNRKEATNVKKSKDQ